MAAEAGVGVPQVITLITGDKVTATRTGGRHLAASVLKPGGGPVGAHVMTVGKDTYIYPDSAMPFLASGALDKRLFSVSELLADGDDDAHSDHLPLIVTYTDAGARTHAAPDDSRRTLNLSSSNGAAVSQSHAHAAEFWAPVKDGDTSVARATGPTARLAGGMAKIWPDGNSKASLSYSTARIGAPQVWQSGGNSD